MFLVFGQPVLKTKKTTQNHAKKNGSMARRGLVASRLGTIENVADWVKGWPHPFFFAWFGFGGVVGSKKSPRLNLWACLA